LAIALAALLAVLSVGAGTVGALAGGDHHEFHQVQFERH
jgi:hypothetical protein